MAGMRKFLAIVLLAALSFFQAPAQAQPRYYNQAELDALLAPVALYPDAVLSQILVAATYPNDVREAAAWSRANPHLKGDAAVRAAEAMPWDPSLKALLAFPDLLARMDESPRWTADLGAAFLAQEPQVMDTIQALRRRAQASGALRSNAEQQVVQQGQAVIIQPAHPQVVYLPYYDPYVVYGPWWWHSYRPVIWRPWHHPPAVFISTSFFLTSVDWHHRHVVRPRLHHRHLLNAKPRIHGSGIPHRVQRRQPLTVHGPVHQAQNPRPIVQGAQIHAPQVHNARPIVQGARLQGTQIEQRKHRFERRREHRAEPRREHRNEPRRDIRKGRQHRQGRG
jgi:hypothetical protein